MKMNETSFNMTKWLHVVLAAAFILSDLREEILVHILVGVVLFLQVAGEQGESRRAYSQLIRSWNAQKCLHGPPAHCGRRPPRRCRQVSAK